MKAILVRTRALVLATILVALVFTFTIAYAQETVAKILITRIDATDFPDISIRAIIRNGNNDPLPSNDISTNIQLYENGMPTTYDYEEMEAGVETIFIVDAGTGINRISATGRTRLDEMKQVMLDFVDSMLPGDSTGIILVTGNGVSVLQPLTSDGPALNNAIASMNVIDEERLSAPYGGILKALEMLGNSSNSTSNNKLVQSMVLLSSGIQDERRPENTDAQIAGSGIPLHVVFVKELFDTFGDRLESLANGNDGLFAHYRGGVSLDNLFNWFNRQRVQYEFKYRSTSSSTSTRVVELRAATGIISGTSTYLVSLFAPIITVNVEPAGQKVTAHVEFTDGYTRNLVMAELLENGEVVSSDFVPGQGELLEFSWDAKTFNLLEESSTKLQVHVVDELGIDASSEDMVVTPSVLAALNCQQYEGLANWRCRGQLLLAQTSNYAGWLALAIAATALLLVYRFRHQIAGGAQGVVEAVKETVARLTQPKNQQVGATLTVLRGGENMPRKKLDLYLGTPTPVGRDRNLAALIFDEGAENSVVSRLHCEFSEIDGIYSLKDSGSTHGTFVNGEQLPELEPVELNNGDQIEIGPAERGGILLLFEYPEGGIYEGLTKQANMEREEGDEEEEEGTIPAYGFSKDLGEEEDTGNEELPPKSERRKRK